jgi:hypothetical protein
MEPAWQCRSIYQPVVRGQLSVQKLSLVIYIKYADVYQLSTSSFLVVMEGEQTSVRGVTKLIGVNHGWCVHVSRVSPANTVKVNAPNRSGAFMLTVLAVSTWLTWTLRPWVLGNTSIQNVRMGLGTIKFVMLHIFIIFHCVWEGSFIFHPPLYRLSNAH